mgnify:CR=1 FL=1
MKNYVSHCNDSIIYPGSYVPLLDDDFTMQKLNSHKIEKTSFPLVNIIENPKSFSIEVAIPGTKREFNKINIENSILNISIVEDEAGKSQNQDFIMHEFEYTCLKTKIKLPDYADTEFMSAEYKNGILLLQVPKCEERESKQKTNIIVY